MGWMKAFRNTIDFGVFMCGEIEGMCRTNEGSGFLFSHTQFNRSHKEEKEQKEQKNKRKKKKVKKELPVLIDKDYSEKVRVKPQDNGTV